MLLLCGATIVVISTTALLTHHRVFPHPIDLDVLGWLLGLNSVGCCRSC